VASRPRTIGPIPGRPTFDVPPSFFEPLPPEELELWDGVTGSDPLAAGWTAATSKRPSAAAESRRRGGARKGRPRRRRS